MGKHVETFGVLTTLLAQRIVAHSTTNAFQVAYPANLQTLPTGITLDTVKDTTSAIPVAVSGEAKLLFNDTVGTGQLVASDSSGRGVPFTLPNTTTSLSTVSCYVGSLIDSSVSATGTIAKVLINPGHVRSSA